jgi:hypothetical protein
MDLLLLFFLHSFSSVFFPVTFHQSPWELDRDVIDPSEATSGFELRRLLESLPPLLPFLPATLVHHCISLLIDPGLLLNSEGVSSQHKQAPTDGCCSRKCEECLVIYLRVSASFPARSYDKLRASVLAVEVSSLFDLQSFIVYTHDNHVQCAIAWNVR